MKNRKWSVLVHYNVIQRQFSSTSSLNSLFDHSFIQSFIHSIIHLFNHSFIQSFIHSIIHSFNHSFNITFGCLWVIYDKKYYICWFDSLNKSHLHYYRRHLTSQQLYLTPQRTKRHRTPSFLVQVLGNMYSRVYRNLVKLG